MESIKRKIIYLFIALLAAIVTTWYAFYVGLNPPMGFLVGCACAYLGAFAVSCFLKVPDFLYVFTLVFVYLASPLGSIMNFYRAIGPYDKIVHFISGILIACFGYVVIRKLLAGKEGKLAVISGLFVFLFASSGAGLWEIFEYVTDLISQGGMQRGMVDTVTDMIAGNLGGLLSGAFVYFKMRNKGF